MQTLNFIDLFSGIGGFRLGFEQAAAELGVQAECVFSSEKDKFARQTYFANFGEEPSGDIKLTKSSEIPDFNILLGGFPCQPFSQAGNQKGFDDERNLFPEIERIARDKRPGAFILENVKALLSKKFSTEFTHIINSLQNLGYTVFYRVYNAKAVVPQNRERVFIVGFKDFTRGFVWPELPPIYPVLREILEFENVPEKYFLTESAKKWIFNHRNKHTLSPNGGYGCRITDINKCMPTLPSRYASNKQILIPGISSWTPYHRVAGIDEQSNTITAQYGTNGGVATLIQELKQIGKIGNGGQGHRIYDINGTAVTQGALGGGRGAKTGLYAVPEITVIDGVEYLINYSHVRRLMPRECARVMGFPDTFKIPLSKGGFPDDYIVENGSDSQAYKQFGNAVVPGVVKEIAKAVIRAVRN